MTQTTIKTPQSGYILMTTLILLVMLTLLALVEISLNSTQIRIAANATNEAIAFQTAEGAMNQAINNILAGNYPQNSFLLNTNGLYLFNPNNAPLWSTINWSGTNSVIQGFQGSSSTGAAYFIEQLPSVVLPGQSMKSPTQVYRITAKGVGSSNGSPVFLQGTIQVQP